MLSQGSLPAPIFGVLQYLLGAFLIAAPFLFSYDSSAAKAVSIVAGVVILCLAAASSGPTGLSKSIPLPASLVLDVAIAALLIAAPFLFGFSKEGAPTAVFIGLGVLQLLLLIATRFRRAAPAGTAGKTSSRAPR